MHANGANEPVVRGILIFTVGRGGYYEEVNVMSTRNTEAIEISDTEGSIVAKLLDAFTSSRSVLAGFVSDPVRRY